MICALILQCVYELKTCQSKLSYCALTSKAVIGNSASESQASILDYKSHNLRLLLFLFGFAAQKETTKSFYIFAPSLQLR